MDGSRKSYASAGSEASWGGAAPHLRDRSQQGGQALARLPREPVHKSGLVRSGEIGSVAWPNPRCRRAQKARRLIAAVRSLRTCPVCLVNFSDDHGATQLGRAAERVRESVFAAIRVFRRAPADAARWAASPQSEMTK